MMASAFEVATQGPSLVFTSAGKKYKLATPWTDELLADLARGALIVPLRTVMGYQWHSWKRGKKRKDLDTLLRDSFSTLGIPGEQMFDLLSILQNDDYCRAFECDLIRLGYDLNMPFREMCILYEGLPEDSRTRYVLEGRKPGDWDRKEYMLADLVDMLNFNMTLTHIVAQVGGLKSKVKAPKPVYKRPYEVEQEKPAFSPTSSLVDLLKARKK